MDIPWPQELSHSSSQEAGSDGHSLPAQAVWGPVEHLEILCATGTTKVLEQEDRVFLITHAELVDSDNKPKGDYTEVLDLGPIRGADAALNLTLLTQPAPPAQLPMDEPAGSLPLPHVAKIAVTITLLDGSDLTWVGAARARIEGSSDGDRRLWISASGLISGGSNMFGESRGVAGLVASRQIPSEHLSPQEPLSGDTLLTLRLTGGPTGLLSEMGQHPQSAEPAEPDPADDVWIVGYGVETNEMAHRNGEAYLVARGEMLHLDSRPMGHYLGSMSLTAPLDLKGLDQRPEDPTLGNIPELPELGDFKVNFELNDGSIDLVGSGRAQIVPLKGGDRLLSITADGIVTGGTGRFADATGVGCIQGATKLPQDFMPTPGVTLPFKTSFQLRSSAPSQPIPKDTDAISSPRPFPVEEATARPLPHPTSAADFQGWDIHSQGPAVDPWPQPHTQDSTSHGQGWYTHSQGPATDPWPQSHAQDSPNHGQGWDAHSQGPAADPWPQPHTHDSPGYGPPPEPFVSSGAGLHNPPGPSPPRNLSELLASLPPGMDPKTYGLEAVDRFMAQIANFLLYGATTPSDLFPIRDRGHIVGFSLNLALRRLEVVDSPPDVNGMQAANLVSSSTPARLQLELRLIPEKYVARYGELPPPTPFDPSRKQRVVVLNAGLRFADTASSGLRFFGTGQTFPEINGSGPLALGLTLVVIDGAGRLQGLPGMAVVNGLLNSSGRSDFTLLVRLADSEGVLLSPSIPPLPSPEIPHSSDSTFLILHGANDVEDPTELIVSPQGRMEGAHLRQQIGLVRTGFELHGPRGLSTATSFGPLVTRLKARMVFDPLAPPPIPFTIERSHFTFFDPQGNPVGRLIANIVDGRGYPTPIPGLPLPIQRGAALAPIVGGSGIFEGARGLVTVSNWITIFPRQVSGFFFIRLMDPTGRYREALRNAESMDCPGCNSSPKSGLPW